MTTTTTTRGTPSSDPPTSRRRLGFAKTTVAAAAGTWLLVGPLASAASAHVVKSTVEALRIDGWCMRIESEVSHGSHGGGYYSGRVESESEWGPWGSVPCEVHGEPIGPHHFRMQMWQWRKPVSGGAAGVCSSTSQIENTVMTDQIELKINHAAPTATCGEGWYENETRGWAMRGSWQTSSVFSGQHCLPTSSNCALAGGK